VKINNLLLITGNPGKAVEFESLLSIKGLKVGHVSLELEEIQSFDLEQIGISKIKSALTQMDQRTDYDALLTDDTGLFCNGLNGLPGPFIKWFLDRLKVEGLFQLMENRDRKTRAVCLLSLGLSKTNTIKHFKGEVNGQLVESRGCGGFGWDKIFKPEGSNQTYGEMSPEEKNRISHRTVAVRELRNWILAED